MVRDWGLGGGLRALAGIGGGGVSVARSLEDVRASPSLAVRDWSRAGGFVRFGDTQSHAGLR